MDLKIPARSILNSTKASFAMEGIQATETDEKNIMDVLSGKRNLDDILKEIKLKYTMEKE